LSQVGADVIVTARFEGGTAMIEPGQKVEFQRECDVVQIPSGELLHVSAGTPAVVTQSLGGTVTLQIPSNGALVRLAGAALDAIGIEPVVTSSEVAGEGSFEDQVWAQLRRCFDPEIPVNIVDLGLVYDLQTETVTEGKRRVSVKMTLTAQGCGMGTVIAADAEDKIRALPEVDEATVEIVWDPPWNAQMISPEGREKLGM
jgi:probable FeS assembly SUF system protein SufT